MDSETLRYRIKFQSETPSVARWKRSCSKRACRPRASGYVLCWHAVLRIEALPANKILTSTTFRALTKTKFLSHIYLLTSSAKICRSQSIERFCPSARDTSERHCNIWCALSAQTVLFLSLNNSGSQAG